jgi:SUMO ligase MMS21 Smc5/6 complex component
MAQQVTFDKLCRICERMIEEQHVALPNHQWDFTHHSFEDLEKSAEQGCHLCSLVLDQLDFERWSKFFKTPEIALHSKCRPLTFTIYRKEYHDPFKLRSEEDTLAILPTEVVEVIVRAPNLSIPKGDTPCIAILSAQFRENAGEIVQSAGGVIS